jgi:hypothetical protein
MNDDPYTDTIPGFIPDDQLTAEWAREHFGARLLDFARQLTDQFAPVGEAVEPEAA